MRILNILGALLCIAGFAAWVWKWNAGMVEFTWYNVLFTAGSAVGILLFSTAAMEKK